MCIWYLCVCVPICIYVTVYLYMHGACMYFTLAIKPGFPGLRGVSKTSVWLGVMMSCFAGQKKTQLLLKAEMFFLFSPWFSPGCPKEKGIKTRIFGCFYGWSVVNSYLLRVSCHHMFLAFSCYFVFIKGLNSYSVIWGIFFGITTRMLKKVWIIYLHWGEQWKQGP